MNTSLSPLIKRIVGGALLALGIFYLIYSGFEFLSPAPIQDWTDTMMMFFFLGMIPSLSGIYLIFRANRQNKIYYQRHIENKVFQLIKRKQRDIMATDLAQEMNWTTEESQKVLQELEIKGVLTSKIDANGHLLYTIY